MASENYFVGTIVCAALIFLIGAGSYNVLIGDGKMCGRGFSAGYGGANDTGDIHVREYRYWRDGHCYVSRRTCSWMTRECVVETWRPRD